jgi:ElaB/YqjD/DUF883 family membrane-anchored ribosome-binding protein
MTETVDAIQNKLSPQNLKDQAKETVRGATVDKAQEARFGIMETIRANPLPAALTGIGLGWLLMNARKQSSGQTRYYQGRRYDYDYPPRYEQEQGTSGSSSAGQALERSRHRAGEATSRAQERAREITSRTQDRVGRLGDRARYQAQRASGGFQRMLQENPLAVSALAAGVGAAVGLAVPETSKEHEMMGEARDNLVERAQDKAQEAQQKVQRVAEEAQSTAREEADNQGLTNQ